MLAVDTNVIVRLLVNDDARQGELARRLFESDEIWIAVTLLLEAAWVLEWFYEPGTDETLRALRGLLGLPNVRMEDSGAVAVALEATGKGLGLADALQPLQALAEAEVATFDRALAKAGRTLRPVRRV